MALDFPSAPATGQVYLSYVYDGVKWSAAQFGSGGVAGPASSTDNAVVRFNGTTGNVVKNSTTFLVTDAGVATLTGTWGLTGTTLATGAFGIVGTTLVTGIFSNVGTANFSGGAFNVTSIVNVVGTANLTGGTFGVTATATFTSGAFNVNGTTTFTAARFGVIGTALFTSNLFSVVGTSVLTGTLSVSGTTVLSAQGTGILVVNAGVVTSAGGLQLLATLSPNNVASTNNTSVFTSTYRTYEITFDNICPATQTTTFQMTVCTTGNAYITTGYISVAMCNVSSVIVTDTSTTAMLLSGVRATTQLLTSTLQGLSGSIRFFNPAASTYNKHIVGAVSFATPGAIATTTLAQAQVNAQLNLSTVITGVNFVFSSGNIQTGTIKIYGMT